MRLITWFVSLVGIGSQIFVLNSFGSSITVEKVMPLFQQFSVIAEKIFCQSYSLLFSVSEGSVFKAVLSPIIVNFLYIAT